MGILDRIFGRWQSGEQHITMPQSLYAFNGTGMQPIRRDSPLGSVVRSSFANNLYQSLFKDGTGYSDIMLSRAYMLSVTAWACINLKASLMSATPIHVVECESGEPIDSDMHPLIGFTENSSTLLSKISTSLDIWGRAYLLKRVNANGYLSGIEFIPSPYVSYYTGKDNYGIPRITGYRIGSENIAPHMMIDIRMFDPNDPTNAVSPLETVMTQISIGRNIGVHAANFFFNGATLSGVLSYPDAVDQTTIQQMKKQWVAQFGGSRKAFKTFISGSDPKYQPTQSSPKDLDMTALASNNAADVARAFGVDPVLIGLGKASDPLSAQGTYDAIQNSQIRNKTIPRAEWIFTRINQQWSWRDFEPRKYYTIAVKRSDVAALSGATQENATLTSALQSAGIVTINESRERMELPPLDGGNGNVMLINGVLYPAERLAEVAAQNLENLSAAPVSPFGLSMTTDNPPASQSVTVNAAQNHDSDIEAVVRSMISEMMPEQKKSQPSTATRAQRQELRNWRKLVDRDPPFEPLELRNHDVARYIRHMLFNHRNDINVDDVFDTALDWINGDAPSYMRADVVGATPEQFAEYWQRYDELKADIGIDWLEWMNRIATPNIEAITNDPDRYATEYSAISALFAPDDQLISAWVGTTEDPGPLVELFAAGVAAGNDAINRGIAANPEKATTRANPEIEIDFNLVNQEALDFARQYMYELIGGINETTAKRIQTIVAQWIESGEPMDALTAALMPIFADERRAEMIAQTESTRVFNEGAFNRYDQVGVTRAKWQTVVDELVCPICRPLHGETGTFRDGWVHPGGAGDSAKYRGNRYTQPAHPRCRCFNRPDFELEDLLV